jgi:hypothetical protein
MSHFQSWTPVEVAAGVVLLVGCGTSGGYPAIGFEIGVVVCEQSFGDGLHEGIVVKGKIRGGQSTTGSSALWWVMHTIQEIRQAVLAVRVMVQEMAQCAIELISTGFSANLAITSD